MDNQEQVSHVLRELHFHKFNACDPYLIASTFSGSALYLANITKDINLHDSHI